MVTILSVTELKYPIMADCTSLDFWKDCMTSYVSGIANESLPSSHNGLGYKNLIKMEFLLAEFARNIEKCGAACIPLLLIEEPESHMHPQMQAAFAT